MKKEVKQWITVNGQHIPIMEGESKKDAIQKAIKNNETKIKKQEDNKEKTIDKNKKEADELNKRDKEDDVDKHKEEQLKIIKKENPMTDDYHTGIRSKDDIKTFEEAYKNFDEDEELVYPDFTEKDVKEALSTGYVMVYSSKDIKNGVFVSTSKQMAQDYAGSSSVKSLRVKLDEVAWINLDEGQLAIVVDKKR